MIGCGFNFLTILLPSGTLVPVNKSIDIIPIHGNVPRNFFLIKDKRRKTRGLLEREHVKIIYQETLEY